MSTDLNKSILIAEDEEMYRKVLKNKLEKDGFNVLIATNGEEALQIARTNQLDLILMDLIMPVKDGFHTLKEMKSDERLKDIKVLILSNLGQEEDVKTVMDLGATDYLVKADIQFSEVIDKIKKNLQ